MAFEVDEDILQDFLVEASEILEQLSEQLVDLEKRPDDKNLLNAIFRGFHTIKGGAGFLGLHLSRRLVADGHDVRTLDLAPLQAATLWDYLERAAHAMVNTFEE